MAFHSISLGYSSDGQRDVLTSEGWGAQLVTSCLDITTDPVPTAPARLVHNEPEVALPSCRPQPWPRGSPTDTDAGAPDRNGDLR